MVLNFFDLRKEAGEVEEERWALGDFAEMR